jgi:hypothetical protein
MFQIKEHQTPTAVAHSPQVTVHTKDLCYRDGCTREYRTRGLCSTHYMYARNHGLVEVKPQPRISYEERLFSYVNVSGVCWEWEGAISSNGYGLIYRDGKLVRAHRAVYEHLMGRIPKGLVCDHLCRNTHCVNPDHIEIVTQSENMRRGYSPSAMNARKTHCVNGHELAWGNIYVNAEGHRTCIVCKASRNRAA